MRFCLAVPTYWTSAGTSGADDIFFDHPTPLDTDGTLPRLLTSLLPLVTDTDHDIVVVAAAAAPGGAVATEARVRQLLEPFAAARVRLFAASHLARLRDFCLRQGQADCLPLLSLDGYGAIRNLTLVLANLLAADFLISLDDDEIILDPHYLGRVAKDVVRLGQDQPLFGLAGLYESPTGHILVAEPDGGWVSFWPKIRWMNETFQALADAGADLVPTPLALGGNMVISAALGQLLPFDPWLPRGEDTDYVLNARMFGVRFFLDPQLRVVHDPPVKPHPVWQRLRQDLRRFWYSRQKLLTQEPDLVPVMVRAEDLMPYPGRFLTEALELMAYRAHTVLAADYLAAGQVADARETLQNLQIFQEGWPPLGVCHRFRQFVDLWRRLQAWLTQDRIRRAALEAVWG